jgi:hypothetical protein
MKDLTLEVCKHLDFRATGSPEWCFSDGRRAPPAFQDLLGSHDLDDYLLIRPRPQREHTKDQYWDHEYQADLSVRKG